MSEEKEKRKKKIVSPVTTIHENAYHCLYMRFQSEKFPVIATDQSSSLITVQCLFSSLFPLSPNHNLQCPNEWTEAAISIFIQLTVRIKMSCAQDSVIFLSIVGDPLAIDFIHKYSMISRESTHGNGWTVDKWFLSPSISNNIMPSNTYTYTETIGVRSIKN